MGNHRFKLSDMIPNAWFYKLRDMGKGRKQHSTTTTFSKKKKLHPPSTTTTTTTITTTTTTSTTTNSPKPKQTHQQQCNTTPRKSYYFTREINQISSSNNNSNKINHTSPRRSIISESNNNSSYCSLQEQPRKSSSSSTQRARRRRRTPRISSPKLVTSSVSAGCSCRTRLESVWIKTDSPPHHHHHHHHHDCSSLSSSSSQFDSSGDSEFHEAEFRTDHVLPTETSSFDEMVSLSTTTTNTNTNTNNNDRVIDVDKNSLARKDDKLEGYEYDSFSELDLPPIITKTSKPKTRISTTTIHEEKEPNMKGSLKVKIVKEDRTESIEKKTKQHQQQRSNASVKGFSVSSPGVKLKINSPRLVGGRKVSNGRKSCSGSRKSISESFAVVKSSFNPQKDFRDSMMEMIVENNMRESKDLEDLLVCYLSLNSDEYHELIINVFKQIWFDLTEKS